MRGSRRRKLLVAISCIAVVAMVGIGFSGAYFSETKAGAIKGTVGSIKISAGVNADTGGGLNLTFNNLLPGEPQSVTVNYKNTGTSPEDVWIVFTDKDALHALNNLGTYGSVSITDVNGGVNWSSANLNDFYPSGTLGNTGVATIYNVPEKMLLQSNVAANASGSMTFTFAYASNLGTLSNSSGGGVWNSYPLATETKNGKTYTAPTGTAFCTLNGLPYKIVAVQVGQQP